MGSGIPRIPQQSASTKAHEALLSCGISSRCVARTTRHSLKVHANLHAKIQRELAQRFSTALTSKLLAADHRRPTPDLCAVARPSGSSSERARDLRQWCTRRICQKADRHPRPKTLCWQTASDDPFRREESRRRRPSVQACVHACRRSVPWQCRERWHLVDAGMIVHVVINSIAP